MIGYVNEHADTATCRDAMEDKHEGADVDASKDNDECTHEFEDTE